jgi:uroporphyrinogen-III decarboxylase
MDSRERLLAAVRREQPDTVPVGLHNIGTYLPCLRRALGRPIGELEALKMFGMDIALYRTYSQALLPKRDMPELVYEPPAHFKGPQWKEKEEVLSRSNGEQVIRRTIETPKGRLSTVEKRTEITCWTMEPLLKKPEDLDLLRFRPVSYPDVDMYRKEFGAGFKEGIVRVGVWGQGEAVLLRGSNDLCKDFYTRPDWVKELYELLTEWALVWVEGLPTEYVDLVEVAGHIGAFVSPDVYEKQIMPFDREVIKALHQKDLPSTYHDCGLVMHVLDLIARTGTDCIETLTPPPFGGDVDLAEAKRLVGDRICLIGGFHQSLLERGPIPAIEARVKECMESAAEGGGYILYNNDHFFDAPVENIHSYVKAARRYGRYS